MNFTERLTLQKELEKYNRLANAYLFSGDPKYQKYSDKVWEIKRELSRHD